MVRTFGEHTVASSFQGWIPILTRGIPSFVTSAGRDKRESRNACESVTSLTTFGAMRYRPVLQSAVDALIHFRSTALFCSISLQRSYNEMKAKCFLDSAAEASNGRVVGFNAPPVCWLHTLSIFFSAFRMPLHRCATESTAALN